MSYFLVFFGTQNLLYSKVIFMYNHLIDFPVAACGESKVLNKTLQNCRARIVGGHDTVKGAYPWQVLIKKDGLRSCGGSLISERFVLTGETNRLSH